MLNEFATEYTPITILYAAINTCIILLCTVIISSVQFSSVQFILLAFINYSTKLHVIIIHLAGSPGSYFVYLKDCLKKRSKKLDCKLSMAEQKYWTETK